jgi:hypothetical protein
MEISGKFYALVALPSREDPMYSLNKRLVGPQNQGIQFEGEENLLPLQGI